MKRILGVLLAGVLLLSGCGQWQKSQKESAYHLYCLDKTGTTLFVTRILISIFRRLRSRSLHSHCVSFVTCAFSVQSEKSKTSILLSDPPVTSFSFRSSCRTSNPFAV